MSTTPRHPYSTNEAAALLRLAPITLRVNLCQKGHYQGVKPFKGANRRLLWPAAEIDALAGITPVANAA
jgi:hypothetical protein